MDNWELYNIFQAFFEAPGYHLALELFLVILILYLVFHKSYKPQRTELTEKEKEQLIQEWEPEPLVPEETEVLEHFSVRTIKGKVGHYVTIGEHKYLNMGASNFLGLAEHPELEAAALKCLNKYGVGSCGPRGFYGTVDIHLELEQKLATFMNSEEAVLYSYGFSTMSSAIPAYSKQGDVIFCDAGVDFAIQKGMVASRSHYRYFKHNDMEDLERLLEDQAEMDRANPKKAKVTRRFLIVEGIYFNYGDICPLPKLIELKKKYKVRLFIDESYSFGILGKTGRGVVEHFDIQRDEVDLITGVLEAAMASYGGFCCGSSFIVDHMRLSGLGYCFSASLPPLQAGVAIAALNILSTNPRIVWDLRTNCIELHRLLKRIPELVIHSHEFSPIKHVSLALFPPKKSLDILKKMVDFGMQRGIAFTISHYLVAEEHELPPPSIRITVSAELSDDNITSVFNTLNDACTVLLRTKA